MLDFYADWCVSCKEMERFTFTDPAVQKKLAGALLLKADGTANDPDDRALLNRCSPAGPPGTTFLGAPGRAIGAVTESLLAAELGADHEFTGFLGARRNGRGIVFHIQSIESK